MNGKMKQIRIGNIYGEQYSTGFAGNVWDTKGLCPCLKCENGGGNRVPLIVVYERMAHPANLPSGSYMYVVRKK